MAQKTASLVRLAVMWGSAGIAFNISQRALDYALDTWFKHVTWLAWLAS